MYCLNTIRHLHTMPASQLREHVAEMKQVHKLVAVGLASWARRSDNPASQRKAA